MQQAMDRAAFEGLWERHESAMRRICAHLVERGGDVPDLVQEIYVRALEQLDRYDRALPFRPWLLTLARHVIVDHLRRRGKWWDIERDIAQSPSAENAPDPILAAESAARLRDAVRRLPEPYRLVILYTAWEGFTPAETAAMLGLPAGRVRIHLYRALQRLAKELT